MLKHRELIKGQVLNVWLSQYHPPYLYFSIDTWKMTVESQGRKLTGSIPKGITIGPGANVEFEAQVITYSNGKQFFSRPTKMKRVA